MQNALGIEGGDVFEQQTGGGMQYKGLAGFELTASDAPGIDYEPQEGALSLAPFGAYIGVVR